MLARESDVVALPLCVTQVDQFSERLTTLTMTTFVNAVVHTGSLGIVVWDVIHR